MRIPLGIAALLAALPAAPAAAVDHNNVDAGRPLRFEDAESIAYREQALEVGIGLGLPRRRPLGFGLTAEYLYGFAMNSHLSLGFDPSAGGRAGEGDTRFDFGDVALGLLHNLNREYDGVPAAALRGDLFLPAGRDSQGLSFRLRGIISRQAGRRGRLHLNADLNVSPGGPAGERTAAPGVLLGYTRPLGYPTRFTTTGLAEIGFQASRQRGAGGTLTAGIGLRKQVAVRGVLDAGIRSDLLRVDGAPAERIRLVAGYSHGF